MNWTTNRYRLRHDDDWISAQQAFTCICWGALLVFAVIYEIAAPFAT